MRRRDAGARSRRAYNRGRLGPMDVTDRHLAIPEGFRVRRPSPADAAAVARIKRSVELALHGGSDVTEDTVREEWALPRLDPDRDVWLVEDGGGVAVAYALCWLETPPGEMVAELTVDPAVRGRGLSEYLLGLCETRAAEILAAAARGRRRPLRVVPRGRPAPGRAVRAPGLRPREHVPAPRPRPRRHPRASGVARRDPGGRVPAGRRRSGRLRRSRGGVRRPPRSRGDRPRGVARVPLRPRGAGPRPLAGGVGRRRGGRRHRGHGDAGRRVHGRAVRARGPGAVAASPGR